MNVKFARPNVTDLMFQVLERSVHPELLTVFAQRSFSGPAYRADVRICQAGHAVSLRRDGRTITEVAAPRDQLLPRQGRSFAQRLSGSRHRSVRFPGGLQYEASFHVERLEPDLFLNFHRELQVDAGRVELAHAFPAGTRFSPEPLSLIRADAQPDSLLIHAYHTFPEECAVVKSQSLFELA